MVNTGSTLNHNDSPCINQDETPHLTINREATIDLDSTNAFEGPEKLLEVWFSPSSQALASTPYPRGLKAVSIDVWKGMLDLVNCKVLSVIETESMDSYLLSESSMFVFPHKLVLKTCGTTTLLYGLSRMLEIAVTEAGFPNTSASDQPAAYPHRVFYSRKNFLYPEQQRGPHRSWPDEVRYLDKLFAGGSAYMIGKMNGDHWYLYTTAPNTPVSSPEPTEDSDDETMQSNHVQLPEQTNHPDSIEDDNDETTDETLEILMTDLDEENARQFYLNDASSLAEHDYLRRAKEARKNTIESLDDLGESDSVSQDKHDSVTDDKSEKVRIGDDDDDNNNTSELVQTPSTTPNMPSPVSDEMQKDGLSFPEELTTEGHALGTVVSDNSGLANIYPSSECPDARIDAYLFTPCGFSANGVVPSKCKNGSSHYFTVHVTPEAHCSYASFETNVPLRQSGRRTEDIVAQILDIFKPGRFSVTLFETKSEDDGVSRVKKDKGMEAIKGYRRVDRVVHDLEGYELVFRYFERDGFVGGGPRLGECIV